MQNQNYSENQYRGNVRYTNYGENRCRRCDHKLSDSTKMYGPYCAQLLGLTERGIHDEMIDSLEEYMYSDKNKNFDTESGLEEPSYYIQNAAANYWLNSGEIKTRGQDILKINGLSLDDLSKNPELLKEYVEDLGGINTNSSLNSYQILYGAWDRPPMEYINGGMVYKPTGNNRYNNYEFTDTDALNYMIMTGGNSNIVLQYRDVQNMTDSEGNPDIEGMKNISAEWQVDVMNKMLKAYEILLQFGFPVQKPKFYVGAVEGIPETLVGIRKVRNGSEVNDYDYDRNAAEKGILDLVLDKLKGNRDVVAGVYFGEDNLYDDGFSRADIKEDENDYTGLKRLGCISKVVHEDYGIKLLYMPFYQINGDDDAVDYFNRVSTAANKKHECQWGYRALIDTSVFQPGTYYFEKGKGLDKNGMYELASCINGWNRLQRENANSQKTSTEMGFELEFDMGLVLGRDDENYEVRSDEKRRKLKEYLQIAEGMLKADPSTPIGIYSGGPNEQGFANPIRNSNTHNTGNYRVQDSWRSYTKDNGRPFDLGNDAFPGNVIYLISDYIYRYLSPDKSISIKQYSPELYDFLNMYDK